MKGKKLPTVNSINLILTNEDFGKFREWLDLNIEAITWQGRYKEEFEDFWKRFFIDGLSFAQTIQRFQYAYEQSTIGPLASWFSWLSNKFVCYVFIKKDVSIKFLSDESGYSLGDIASMLRSFFIENLPYKEEEFSETFQICNLGSENISLTYSEFIKTSNLDDSVDYSSLGPEDVMSSLEITLYDEWRDLNNKMKKELFHPGFDFNSLKSKASVKKQVYVIRDIAIMFIVGAILIFGIREANKFYKKILSDKISIYEPQFKWLDKNLTFKKKESVSANELKIELKDIEKVDKAKNVFDLSEKEDETRYEDESEVALTSWNHLPKDFDVVNLEQSDYEELRKRGYRESRYGNTKVYRVLMQSEDVAGSQNSLNFLLKKYLVTQVDHVKPGTKVPGGIYYNLYVPRNYLKEFMAQVMDLGHSVLYESRTRTRRNPPGKNKVFIWVKSI